MGHCYVWMDKAPLLAITALCCLIVVEMYSVIHSTRKNYKVELAELLNTYILYFITFYNCKLWSETNTFHL